METDRLAEDLQRLGDRSVTEVRKCVISVARFSTDDEIEVRMLNNNPTGHEGTDMIALQAIGMKVLLMQSQNSKAPLAQETTISVDCRENNNRPRNRFEG